MLEILDGFSKRMEFIAIVDSITNRKNTTDKIEQLFKDNQMENLIISTLIYIMEVNLADEEKATIGNISLFLKKLLEYYNLEKGGIDAKELARYIIKDILQNKGQNRYFKVKNYNTNKDKNLNIRLISDKENDDGEVYYELTQQGYDFLFRTKEVDDELGFKMEEMKLKMLILKKNYKKAIVSSQELIRMLKNRKMSLEQFESSFKNNINNISGTEYENLINRMYETLDDGYKEMQELEIMINKSKEQIQEEEKIVDVLDEKSQNAKKEIWRISNNIKIALNLQIVLLSSCKNMKNLYLEVLQEAMEYTMVKTFNFKDVILDKMERVSFEEVPNMYVKLLRPLFMPTMNKTLNLSLCYDKQSKISNDEQEEYSIEQELLESSMEVEKRITRRNNAHVESVRTLLEYADKHREGFMLSEYMQDISENTFYNDMLCEKLLLMELLKLYSFQVIDLENWKEDDENSIESNGEFDLAYCLKKIKSENPNLYGIKKVIIEKSDDVYTFEYQYPNEEVDEDIGKINIEKYEITNFKFIVE